MILSIFKKKHILAAIIGHVIERYDVMLFGFLAQYISKFFFPEQYFSNSYLFTFGSFAAGYVMRPIGGIIFGYIGDKYGRKKALVCSIILVSFPTVIIGLLPNYYQIGIWSPILLLLCRLMQGICVAGEWTGASIYFYEHASPNQRSFSCGIMCATAFLGAVLATLCATICIRDNMPLWSWRLPFIMGGILGPISYFIRKKMEETQPFIKSKEKEELLRLPILSVFKNNKLAVCAAMCVGIQGHIPLYLSTVYTNTLLNKQLMIAQWLITLDNCLILSLWIIVLLVASRLADIIGKERIMLISSIFAITMGLPTYIYAYAHMTLHSIITLQVILTIIGASFLGPSASLIPELFDVRTRYSGIGFGLTFGQAVLGGMTPMIATLLVKITHDIRAPSILFVFGGIIGLFPIFYNWGAFKSWVKLQVRHEVL